MLDETNNPRGIFINMSIRGRVAYGICCLQNTLIWADASTEEWHLILDHLWEFTESENIEEWFYSTAEYLPEYVLDNVPFHKRENEYVSQSFNDYLATIYRKTNPIIYKIMDAIFMAGTIEMYGSIVDGGQQSLSHIIRLIDIMKSNNIPLPDYSIFKKFTGSWGRTFSREEVNSQNSII